MCRGGFNANEQSWGNADPPESLRSESPGCRRRPAGGVTASTPISIRLPLPLLLLGHAGTADAEVGAVAEVDADTDARGLGARRPPCGCGKSRSDASFSPVTFFRPYPGGPRVASYWPVRSSLSSVLWEEEMGGRWAKDLPTTIPSMRGGLVNAVGPRGARTVCRLTVAWRECGSIVR
ncbi:hypothetical protein EDB92DRAFT_1826257 [Lactarius akahatsu]|uniref:Uncharacterized protein n=1 Tax=Lactarius akahatsu TaxID=416441 RepID=A0AAD4LVB2_9AGAM|nr:hypothetical protein EDB92DRAFT_1826257 [Lactarius akahatsu]